MAILWLLGAKKTVHRFGGGIEGSGGHLGERLGAFWGALRCILVALGVVLAESGSHLGANLGRQELFIVLGLVLTGLRAILGGPGAFWGASWELLGRSSGALWGILGFHGGS